MQKHQRFIQIPTIDIKIFADWEFDHISRFIELEIIILRSNIDKPHIIVTVGRRETPCPTAGFYSVKNSDVFGLFNFSQPADNNVFYSSLLCFSASYEGGSSFPILQRFWLCLF